MRMGPAGRSLADKVAVVAGASRGCGRGIALALGDAGATVYVTARTWRGGPVPNDGAPGTIEDTAEEVTRRGGRGIPLQVDYREPARVAAALERIHGDRGRLDVLAMAVWGGNERYLDPAWNRPFWEQPIGLWQEWIGAGPQALWLAAHGAARIMHRQRAGMIVAITEPIIEMAFEGQHDALADTFGQVAHEAMNRLVRGLAPAARDVGVAVLGLMPGFMKTERVEMHLDALGSAARAQFRYDLAETPEYTGRAVAALAADPRVIERAGKLLHVAELAEEYGFSDADGRRMANFYRAVGAIS
jgi:NAD(P)-dependent dehydrogenase (short-subunit alcohol dehydrogenase family)